MYVRDNKFYFSKNDCIYFDNLELSRYNRHNFILRKLKYDYNFHVIDLELSKQIKINILDAHVSQHTFFILLLDFSKTTKSIVRNKRIYLETLKKIFDAAYNSLLIIKKYNLKLADNVEFLNSNLKNVVRCIYGSQSDKVHYIRFSRDYNDHTYDKLKENRLEIIEENRSSLMYYLSIKRNVLRCASHRFITTIYFPKEFGYPVKCSNINFDFGSFDDYKNYISKSKFGSHVINVRSDIPQSLLLKFANNVDMFKNLDEFVINNELDLMKYM